LKLENTMKKISAVLCLTLLGATTAFANPMPQEKCDMSSCKNYFAQVQKMILPADEALAKDMLAAMMLDENNYIEERGYSALTYIAFSKDGSSKRDAFEYKCVSKSTVASRESDGGPLFGTGRTVVLSKCSGVLNGQKIVITAENGKVVKFETALKLGIGSADGAKYVLFKAVNPAGDVAGVGYFLGE